ncbi:CoA transferase [Burkholderia sp. PAMC 26561]|uniref:CoA transferase n=1 Tax=Burkholderia sp. PAMC 26561 TaxID=1795043 RepID=UPI00076B719B|nr:CoA transferase [Burkholderia sp. PAMC 26561]AME22887.1 carnitine dehydratase [Burkholderia sp. PAMC 26561]
MNFASNPLATLWHLAGRHPETLSHLTLSGDERQLPSVYRVSALASASIGASALAAADCFRQRTGQMQQVELDAHRATVAFRSERYLRIDADTAPELRDPLTGFYETRNGRWIQLHTNFKHHRDGVVKLLGCANDHAGVSEEIRHWDGATLDQALADAGLCAALIRTPEEWSMLPQARAIAETPLLEITRLGDAPPEPIGNGERPLSGVRVLDVSRIIAGPVAGRTLAEHGANVLLINGPHLPNIAPLVIDNGRGKRSATLDLRDETGRTALRALLKDADVFLQGYRPGALEAKGFGPAEAALKRPGIVYVTVSAYGHKGPWSQRRGFDSLVQSASGIAWTEAQAAGQTKPRHLPCQALDHATGYLAAFGAMTALQRRAEEGGSWHVRVSLAGTGRWLQSMGLIEDGQKIHDPKIDDVRDVLQTIESPFGSLTLTQPPERMSMTPPFWSSPPVEIGTDEPRWT